MTDNDGNLSFWEHLDDLRTLIITIIIPIVLLDLIAFCFKQTLFHIVLAPANADFITYRFFNQIAAITGAQGADFNVQLINTGLARQFILHMKTAICAGVLCASPYILYQAVRFLSPPLYPNERHYLLHVAGAAYLMFPLGGVLSFFLLFPLTFRFLGTYHVSATVVNMISLDSYMATLITMSFALAILFEMPVMAWLFDKLNLITADFMRRYQKHAVVIILSLAAIITPSSHIFTMLIVAAPMGLLYEASILILRLSSPK